MNDGLKDNYRQELIDTLSQCEHVEKVVLFGSRAMGTFTTTSDIDIVLFGNDLTLTDQARLAEQREELTFRDRCVQSMVGSSRRQRVQNACFSSFYVSIPEHEDLLGHSHLITDRSFFKITKHSAQSRVLTHLRAQLLSGEMRIPEAAKLVEDLDRNGGGNGKG